MLTLTRCGRGPGMTFGRAGSAEPSRRAGARESSDRGCPRRGRHPCAGHGLGAAPARGPRRRNHSGRRARGAVGAARAGEVVDAARNAAPASRGRDSGSGPRLGGRSSATPTAKRTRPRTSTPCVAAIGDALRGRQLTREALADEVAAVVGEEPRAQLASGWGDYLGDAAESDQLCFGPPEGAKVTFVHPDDWLGARTSHEAEAALRDVARRYLAAYGPATHREFRKWFSSRSFLPGGGRRALRRARSRRGGGGAGAGHSCSTTRRRRQEASSVRLLPEYDVYVMGFREREQLVPAAVQEQVAAHGKGRYEGAAGTPFLLVDGVCAGIWRRRKRSRKIELTVEPAKSLTRAHKGRCRSGGRADRCLPRARAGAVVRLSEAIVRS